MKFSKGRGRLGCFRPLIGRWVHEDDKLRCERSFAFTLGRKYVELQCHWKSSDYEYLEKCLFGVNDQVDQKGKREKSIGFWSFTSDGKRSSGHLAQARDLHENAIAFEAQMPSGYARQVYWPKNDEDAFHWVVESRNKKGWKRFVEHIYRPVKSP